MNTAFLDEVKRYVSFGLADERALVGLRPILLRHARGVVDVFYERVLDHPRAGKAITGGPTQVERLKETLRRWLVELASGDYGAEYLERRAAIGKRHVLIELPQVFMVTAISVVRRELCGHFRREVPADEIDRALEAIHKILDIDLAIMLETYQEANLERVRESERRAAVGELAARVNHELRTRLGIIKSSTFLLEKQLGDASEAVKRHLKKVQWGAERAASIVHALLNLAKELEPTRLPIDLNQIVRDAAACVQAPPTVTVEFELGELPQVEGDAELLEAAVTNLVQNAIEAQDDVRLRVVLRTQHQGEYVSIVVSDDGKGLAPDVLPRIFEPFFTTKPEGTGLGLTLAREIVLAHKGRIEARSRAKGAEFLVHLPGGKT